MSYPRNAGTPKAVTVGSVILIADGTVQTSGCSVRVDLDGGGWGAGGGPLAYDATSGVVTYAPIQAETNGDVLMIAVYKASCIGCSVTVLMDHIALPQAAPDAAGGLPISDAGGLDLDAILADTNELQTNQGNWLTAVGFNTVVPDAAGVVATALALLETHGDSTWATATGFSTHTAANVVTALGTGSTLTACATATGFLTQANIRTAVGLASANLDTQLGTLSTHDAAAVKTAIEAAGSSIALILADTGELQTDDIPGTLVTIAGYLDTEIAAIKGVTDALPDAGALTTIAADAARLTAARAGALTDLIDGGRLDLILDALPTTAEVNAEVLDVLATDTLIDGKTLVATLRYLAAGLVGELSGAGTGEETALGLDGVTARVVATVDEDGNRTGMSYDPE